MARRWSMLAVVVMMVGIGCGDPDKRPLPSSTPGDAGRATVALVEPTATRSPTAAVASPSASPTPEETATRPADATNGSLEEPDWTTVARLELDILGNVVGYVRDEQGRTLGIDPKHPELGFQSAIPDSYYEPGNEGDTFQSPTTFRWSPTGLQEASFEVLDDGWIEIELTTENGGSNANGKVSFPALNEAKGTVLSLRFGPGMDFADIRVTVDRQGDNDPEIAPIAWITGPSSDESENPDVQVRLAEQPSGQVLVTLEASDSGGSGVANVFWWDFSRGFPNDETELLRYTEAFEVESGTALSAGVIDRAGNWGSGDYLVVLEGDHEDVAATLVVDGPSLTLATTDPGQNVRATFEGRADQVLTLDAQDVAFNSRVTIVDAAGVAMVAPVDITNGSGVVGLRLPSDGTYTVFVNPEEGATGSLTLALTETGDVRTEIVPDGPPQLVDITVPRQNVYLTFDGEEGQRYVVAVSDVAFENDWRGVRVTIVGPNGQPLTEPEGILSDVQKRMIEVTLPSSGVWTVLIEPTSERTGGLTVQLFATEHSMAEIEIDGAPVTVTAPEAEDTAALTFTGRAGQRLQLRISDIRFGDDACCAATVSITPPPGAEWDYFESRMLDIGEFVGTQGKLLWMTLPADGIYTIVIDPEDDRSGSATLELTEVRDVTTTVSIDGGPITVTMTVPRQDVRVMFDGNFGDEVVVTFTDVFEGSSVVVPFTMTLLDPDGSSLNDPYDVRADGDGRVSMYFFELPDTGTYTILLETTILFDPTAEMGSATIEVASE